MDILIKFLFACYLIFSIGPTYGFAFIAAFVVMHYFVIVCNKYAIKRRRLRKEEEANISRQLIRMIMSKQEILQNEKMNQEIKLLDKYSMEAHSYNVRVSDFLRAMFNIPLFLTYLLNILTLVYVYLSIRDGYFSL